MLLLLSQREKDHFFPITRRVAPHPEFFFFFFLGIGFTSAFSSSESDKKTCLQNRTCHLNFKLHTQIVQMGRQICHTFHETQASQRCWQEASPSQREIPHQFRFLHLLGPFQPLQIDGAFSSEPKAFDALFPHDEPYKEKKKQIKLH